MTPASVNEGGRFRLYAMRYRKPSRALTSAARKVSEPSAARAFLVPGIGSVARAHANELTQTESVSARNTRVRVSIFGGVADVPDIAAARLDGRGETRDPRQID